jgi:hypothetical protein
LRSGGTTSSGFEAALEYIAENADAEAKASLAAISCVIDAEPSLPGNPQIISVAHNYRRAHQQYESQG